MKEMLVNTVDTKARDATFLNHLTKLSQEYIHLIDSLRGCKPHLSYSLDHSTYHSILYVRTQKMVAKISLPTDFANY